MVSLTKTAVRFAETFPSVHVDGERLGHTLQAFDTRTLAPRTRLTNLAGALLLDPPVDDLAVPFAHELLVAALRRLGADSQHAELHGAGIVEGIVGLGERPLFGLQISIGAPRRGVPVTLLSRLDEVIESLHARLAESFAHPVGPQEHAETECADGLPGSDKVPSDQWTGHVTNTCVPGHRHDALVVLPGRSVGVGESIAIAADLVVPVFAVAVPGLDEDESGEEDEPPTPTPVLRPQGITSCRIKHEDAIQHVPVSGAVPVDVADQVVAALELAAPDIRRQQRIRMRHMLRLGEYRAYLGGQRGLGTAGASTRRRIEDPFEFASLTELQRDVLASEVGALSRNEYDLLAMLGPEARAGFDAFVASCGGVRPSVEPLLRTGLREMARFADEPLKASRPYVWDDEGWRRLWDNMGQP